MSDQLKPCPFCGGKATMARTARAWKVECEGRFGSCLMNARTHYQPHKHMALTAWNARTPDLAALALAGRDLQAAVSDLLVVHNGPAEAKRPDVFQRLMQRLADAEAAFRKAEGESDE